MTILHDGVGQQDGERDCALGEQGDEYQVRSRFRDNADQYGNDQYDVEVVLNPCANVHPGIQIMDRQQGAEGPEKYPRQVPLTR